jgi:hypothetical protein
LLVLSKIANSLFLFHSSSLSIMFLTLVSVDICLWIFSILVLENIDQPKKYSTLDSNTSEQIHNIYIYIYIYIYIWTGCCVLEPGSARRVDLGPGRPGAGTGPGWWKNSISHDPVWPGKTRSKTRLQPVDFFFY